MPDFVSLLASFLLIHVIFDFYLQPKGWVIAKRTHKHRSWALYIHSLLHGAGLIFPALIFGIDWTLIVYAIALVSTTHFAIDLWKVVMPKGDSFSYFLIDQALHILVLVSIAFFLSDGVSVDTLLQSNYFDNVMLVSFAYLLILKPTSIVIGSILKKYPLSSQGSTQANGLIAGGELIGYLERILILTFTLTGSYTAVGFVIAAKSIFRFGELNKSDDRSMTEYVLIGSLLSVVITTIVGTLTTLLCLNSFSSLSFYKP